MARVIPSPRQCRLDLAEMMTRLLHHRSSTHSFSACVSPVGPDQAALPSATVSRLLLPLQSFGGILGPCTVSGRRQARVPLVYLRLRWRSGMGEPPSERRDAYSRLERSLPGPQRQTPSAACFLNPSTCLCARRCATCDLCVAAVIRRFLVWGSIGFLESKLVRRNIEGFQAYFVPRTPSHAATRPLLRSALIDMTFRSTEPLTRRLPNIHTFFRRAHVTSLLEPHPPICSPTRSRGTAPDSGGPSRRCSSPTRHFLRVLYM